MNNKSRMTKILIKAVSYILVACLASVMTLALFAGSPTGGMVKLRQIQSLIEERFIGQADRTEMFDAAAAGMVAGTGDRWSYYVSASEMDSFNRQKDNAYVGVGITISMREDGLGADILRLEPEGPAAQAGIQAGDILYRVENQSVGEIGMDAAGALIAGEEGTQVQITVLRQEQEMEFTLTRQTVLVAVAEGQLLPDNTGYIRIANFNSNCADQTIACVEKLISQGAQSLLFDVRYNGGGYVTELVKLLDYLLPEGDLFISEDYLGNRTVETSDAASVELPMAVLVNGSSYSAAEFFAAALREYDKASVIGLPTTGKGYFQSTYTLIDGSAVALSIGKYYTPKGVSLADEGGLVPDVTVEVDEQTASAIYARTLAAEEDPQIQAAIKLLSGE